MEAPRFARDWHYFEWFFGTWQSRAAKPTTTETPMLRLLKRAGFIETQRA